MKADADPAGWLRTTRFLAKEFEISIFELIFEAPYINPETKCKLLLLASAQ